MGFDDARAMMPMPTTMPPTTPSRVRGPIDGRRPRATTTTTRAMKPTGVTRSDLESNENKRAVVDVDGVGAVLLQEFMGDVYAVSNACPHMGLSMQGKTPLLSAKVGGDCEITCPVSRARVDVFDEGRDAEGGVVSETSGTADGGETVRGGAEGDSDVRRARG